MGALVVGEQGVRVAVRDRRFVVLRGERVLTDMPFGDVDSVVLIGGVEPSLSALRVALARGIDVVFLAADGRFVGRLQGGLSRSVHTRVAQLRRLHEPEPAIMFVRAVVSGKLANQRQLLLRTQRRRPSDALGSAAARLRLLERRVERTVDIDGLRGLEGAGAAAYFGAFGELIADERFPWNGRNRRPPRDPVNAALGLGYGLLLAQILRVVERVGLDPFVGALHVPEHGRPSLALDLMEEWRPVLVDGLVLGLFNRRQFTPSDFGPPEVDHSGALAVGGDPEHEPEEIAPEAVHLRRVARKVLVSAFRRRLEERTTLDGVRGRITYAAALEEQARRVVRWLLEEGPPYVAHRTR